MVLRNRSSGTHGLRMGSIKQVILIRKDLKMRRGKEIAQGSHASMEFLVSRIRQQPERETS